MAVISVKDKQVDQGSLQLKVKELGLGAAVGSAQTITLTGTVSAAGTGSGSAGNSGGAVATNVLAVDVAGTTYYIPLCNTNA